MKKAYLILEDETCFEGLSFGSTKDAYGEVVFNTCMSGYQEILTDPSYKGQIVTMTYPLIGNYGFNDEDNESYKPHVQGFIVKELCDMPSNWRNSVNPHDFFVKNDITGISDIDTRRLTLHIRKFGSMQAIITTKDNPDIKALAYSAKQKNISDVDLVDLVSRKKIEHYKADGKKVVLVDFGTKQNIIRSLNSVGLDVYCVPAKTSIEEIEKLNPDGIMLSNGPGDPENIPYAIETIKKLVGKYPVMGICLGHQLLGLALGAKTYKLKFGHHGGNQPVKNLITGKVTITSQNHNYALSDNLPEGMFVTHINLNDNSIEGFGHKDYKILSVQYHPEAAPGPLDSLNIFNEFKIMLEGENNA